MREREYCFICGIENDKFGIENDKFEQAKVTAKRLYLKIFYILYRVKNDHNMWSYICFVIHLDTIDPNDHNAMEKYVYENVSLHLIA